MKSINVRISELILRAQNASDGGKGIDELVSSRKSYRDNCAGYAHKDKFVYLAVNMIASNKTDFRFAVTEDKDCVADFIVYFECRTGAEKRQVSFHSFDERLRKFVKRSFRIKWDHADSRDSACDIYNWYH